VTTSTLAAPAASTRGRGASIALWALQILLAAAFAFGGLNKLFALQTEVVESFARMGFGVWFRYLVGALELAGAIGLLIPRLSGLAALGLAGVMLGAVGIHLVVLPPVALALVPGTIATVFLLIARARRSEIKALFDKTRG
jgi:putative oxidoreductase